MSLDAPIDIEKATISRGEWHLRSGDYVEIGWPLIDTGDTVSDPFLKRVCGAYDDTDSEDPTIGVALTRYIAKPDTFEDQILKPLWLGRDLGVVIEGEVRMKNMQSGYTAIPGDTLAPYPSGFVQHSGAMAKMAMALEVIPWQKFGRVLLKRVLPDNFGTSQTDEPAGISGDEITEEDAIHDVFETDEGFL